MRREAIRSELHQYGALSAEPDLEACCVQLERVAHNPAYEDFLRKAGGLKHELIGLVQVRKAAGRTKSSGEDRDHIAIRLVGTVFAPNQASSGVGHVELRRSQNPIDLGGYVHRFFCGCCLHRRRDQSGPSTVRQVF